MGIYDREKRSIHIVNDKLTILSDGRLSDGEKQKTQALT